MYYSLVRCISVMSNDIVSFKGKLIFDKVPKSDLL